jgi:hypothetical protein
LMGVLCTKRAARKNGGEEAKNVFSPAPNDIGASVAPRGATAKTCRVAAGP